MSGDRLGSNDREELITRTENFLVGLGDSTINPEGDRYVFQHDVKPKLEAFLNAVIDNRNRIDDLHQQFEIKHNSLQNNIEDNHQELLTKITSLEEKLNALQATADTLNNLSQQQQGELGILLQAQRIRKDAQTVREQALQLAQRAQTEADEAQLAAPDALSLEAIMKRAEDARQASEKAGSSAMKAIATADKATQKVASLAESDSLENLSSGEDEQPGSNSGETIGVNPVEAQTSDSGLPEDPEEIVGIARRYVDEAMKFKDEAQKITSEVKDLVSKITQEYDNWSVVQNLFSIAK